MGARNLGTRFVPLCTMGKSGRAKSDLLLLKDPDDLLDKYMRLKVPFITLFITENYCNGVLYIIMCGWWI